MNAEFYAGQAQTPLNRPWEMEIRFSEPVADALELLVHAELADPYGNTRRIEGFCDDPDGRVYRLRVLPTVAGLHRLTLEAGDARWSGQFHADDLGLSGLLRAKAWHFEDAATGEAFFWNSTTTYMLAGLAEPTMLRAIDRLADAGINRLRVSLCPSRQESGQRWFEPQVTERANFTFRYAPWPCSNPASALEPDFDVSRFDIDYWRKFEKLLTHALDRGVRVQVIFYTDAQEPQNYPFDRERVGDDPNERRYYRYAIARLAAFPNVEWCVTNEWALYRPDAWVEALGSFVAEHDPYQHLLSVHGHGHFPFRESAWCSHALFQVWDEHGGHDWMLEKRREQLAAGTPKPQVNEEFGYEDHYPGPWGEGRRAPARDADSRARLAWEITMAGGWCTTGEAAGSRGGWITGLGDDPSELLELHTHLRAFFERFDWWRTEPDDGRVSAYGYCRSNGADLFAVYAYLGGTVSVTLPDDGPWTASAFNPRTGEWSDVERITHEADPSSKRRFVSPHQPFGEPWAYLVQRA